MPIYRPMIQRDETRGMMVLRRSNVFSAALAFALCGALEAHAGGVRGDGVQLQAAPSQRANVNLVSSQERGDIFVELLAADFFESDLRLAQSRQIEAETANLYLSLDSADRARFRAARKEHWRRMSADDRAGLRGVKLPRFANLDENQKAVFRRIAREELGAASAGDEI